MPSPANRPRVLSLARVGAAFGAVTGCLGACMVCVTRVEPALEAGGGVVLAVLAGAAIGWFGAECLGALTNGLGEVSE